MNEATQKVTRKRDEHRKILEGETAQKRKLHRQSKSSDCGPACSGFRR